jgi:hypothetical protein
MTSKRTCGRLSATHSSARALHRSPEGGGAPKSADLWCPRSLAGPRRAPRGAPQRRLSGDGRAFRLGHRARTRPKAGGATRFQVGRRPVAQHLSRQPAPGRASYWTRAEPRCRPSARLANRTRRHRTSSRDPRRLMRTPLQKDEVGAG